MSSLNIRRIIVGVICLAVYVLTWLVAKDSFIIYYIIVFPVAPISYRRLIGKVEGKSGTYLSIVNSVLVCAFLLIIIFDLGAEPGWTIAAAFIWFWINKAILKSATILPTFMQGNIIEQPEQKEPANNNDDKEGLN